MNQEWSELNKTMQLQIKKETTFAAGIAALLDLRENHEKILLDKESRGLALLPFWIYGKS